MAGEKRFLPVNWIDGMKISRVHFEATGLYSEFLARDAASVSLSPFNYGIISAEPAFDLQVSCDFNQQIAVTLSACQAVTPAGYRISVFPDEPVKAQANFREIASRFSLATTQTRQLLVILTVNPFSRIPSGEPMLDETPPRHPYTRPEIRIEVLPAEMIQPSALGNGLVISRIIYQNGELQVEKDFIPAGATVQSLPLLRAWFSSFREMLDNWEQYCIKIIQKINSKTQSAQPNVLAGNLLRLCEHTLGQLVRQKVRFQWTLLQEPPVQFCSALMENLHVVQAAQQFYSEKDREEMLNYFAEWTDTAPGAFEKQALQLFSHSYNHDDIAATLRAIHQLYESYTQLFLKLSLLDFIGKKKGQNIFVIEQEVKPVSPQPNPKPNSRWSPLS